ncbi:MAG: lipid-A-disaccharide synthase [Bdellovibrionota bacterium]
MKTLFLVAGEASADSHAATIVRQLKQQFPDLRVLGIGGPALRAEGMDCIVDSNQVDVMGITEVFSRFSELRSSYERLKKTIRDENLDAALLIDLPDLNLMIARHLKAAGVPVAYFVSPQVWVWRRYRIHKIKKRIDRMLVLFPFEQEFYKKHQVPCDFVGHPLVDSIRLRAVERTRQERLSAPRIAIVPGSRRSEIGHHSNLLRDAVLRLQKRYPTASFLCPIAKNLSESLLKEAFGDLPVVLTRQRLESVVASVDVSLTASGTATLETALVGTPQVMFYKLNRSTAWLFQLLSRYRTYFSLPNIVLQKAVIPEYVQHQATGEALEFAVSQLLESDTYRREMVAGYEEIRARLGKGGSANLVAGAVQKILQPSSFQKPGVRSESAHPSA